MLLARALSAQAQLVCYGGRGLIRDWRGRRDVPNGPQIFDLAVADDRPRAVWDHASYLPDVVVVSLGTNDFNLALGPFPEREEFVTAYVAFVRAIRARYPAAAIILTEGARVATCRARCPATRAAAMDSVRKKPCCARTWPRPRAASPIRACRSIPRRTTRETRAIPTRPAISMPRWRVTSSR